MAEDLTVFYNLDEAKTLITNLFVELSARLL